MIFLPVERKALVGLSPSLPMVMAVDFVVFRYSLLARTSTS